MKPTFFTTPDAFRSWLDRHHQSAKELLVGFHRKGAGRPSITWPESVDQALCFGWIDGVRRRIDDDCYSIRFTPRRLGSRWSAVNMRRANELIAQGLMKPAGKKALEARSEAKSKTYSYEQSRATELETSLTKVLKANPEAETFMGSLAPSYQRKIVHWVMAARSAVVRLRRLRRAMSAFEKGKKL